MKRLTAGLMSFALMAGTAVAAPPGEGVVGIGIGADGCGEYLKNRRTPDPAFDNEVVQWTDGFISAYNFYAPRPQVRRVIAGPTILAFLDKYCRENPLASTGLGVSELIRTLAKP